MPDSRSKGDNMDKRNIQNIEGGQGMQVNDPNAPVIQAGSNATFNFYGETPGNGAKPMPEGSSAGKRQRLMAEQERLNQNWQTTHERLGALESAYAIEAAAAQKFQLEKQIEAAKIELQAIATRLDKIEALLANSWLEATGGEPSKKITSRKLPSTSTDHLDSTREQVATGETNLDRFNIFIDNTLQPMNKVKSRKSRDFVGRDENLLELDNYFHQGTKIVVIQALGGIGKTELAKEYLHSRGFTVIAFPMALERQNITNVEAVIEDLLHTYFKVEPGKELDVSLNRLFQNLCEENIKIGFLIDNLETALNENGKFIESHRRYVNLLNVLCKPEVKSFTIITSRERLGESDLGFKHYCLRSLSLSEWKDFFESKEIVINQTLLKNEYSLAKLHHAWGGNAKAMEIISSEIKTEYSGDIDKYWKANQDYLFNQLELNDLVVKQFLRLQELNPDSYTLLCRLGCYRYQDVSTIPTQGIYCLLPDHLSKNECSRILRVLKDRSLIESSNENYRLHPVIQQVSREKIQGSEWRESNLRAAKFLQESITSIESVEDAKKALEPFFHYAAINDFEKACNVIVEERNTKWDLFESLATSFDRLGLAHLMISAINPRINNIENTLSSASLCRMYDTLGDIYWDIDIHKAIDYYSRSGKLAKECRDFEYMILFRYNMGLCKISLEEIEEGLIFMRQARVLSECFEDEKYELYSCFCLAYLTAYCGDYDEAIKLVARVEDGESKIHFTTWGKGYMDLFLASTYKLLKNYCKSYELYSKAIIFSETLNYKQIKAKALYGLADLYREQGFLDDSINTHKKAMVILKDIGAIYDLAEASYKLALTYRSMGDNEVSNNYFQEAIQLFVKMSAEKQVKKLMRLQNN